MKKLLVLLTITGFTACATASEPLTDAPTDTPAAEVSETSQIATQAENTPFDAAEEGEFSAADFDEPFIRLGGNGNVEFAWRRDKDGNAVFYAIRQDDTEPPFGREEILATFPPDHNTPVHITQFGLLDDWIILSVGSFQGSGRNWFGDLVRMRTDGSQLENFRLETSAHGFHIMDGWLYYDYWEHQAGRRFGVWRMRADGSEHEDLSDLISTIHVARGGYLYGVFSEISHTLSQDSGHYVFSISSNLVRVNSATGEKFTLFRGDSLPEIENARHTVARYVIREIGEDFVHFNAQIWGINEIYEWREGMLFNHEFVVDNDGENLTPLGFGNLEWPWEERSDWENWQINRKHDLRSLRGRIVGNVAAGNLGNLDELTEIVHGFTGNTRISTDISSISLIYLEHDEESFVRAVYDSNWFRPQFLPLVPRFLPLVPNDEIFWFMRDEYSHEQAVAAIHTDFGERGARDNNRFTVGMSLGLLPREIFIEMRYIWQHFFHRAKRGFFRDSVPCAV